MAEVKLSKNELRQQQNRYNQLQRYLPTLQLKKAMLQTEVTIVRAEILDLERQHKECYEHVMSYCQLFSLSMGISIEDLAKIEKINKRYENIAGVEIPFYESVVFQEPVYHLFETPEWVEVSALSLRKLVESRVKVDVAKEKLEALQKELREVSIRVNLFEKVMIPKALKNIKKIKVFLGDQQLAAVSQAKVAKAKKIALEEMNACA